jgi:hypothetical protein
MSWEASVSDVIDRNDPDLIHLLRLVALLPLPDDVDFWEQYGEVQNSSNQGDYMRDKIGAHLLQIEDDGDEVERRHVEVLTSYLLMFFAAPTPKQLRLLERVARDFHVDTDNAIGRLWGQDLKATAWKLWVDCSDPGGEGLQKRIASWSAALRSY